MILFIIEIFWENFLFSLSETQKRNKNYTKTNRKLDVVFTLIYFYTKHATKSKPLSPLGSYLEYLEPHDGSKAMVCGCVGSCSCCC